MSDNVSELDLGTGHRCTSSVKNSTQISAKGARTTLFQRRSFLWQTRRQNPENYPQIVFLFVLRKKGSGMKKRKNEEEKEKDDCGPPTRKVF